VNFSNPVAEQFFPYAVSCVKLDIVVGEVLVKSNVWEWKGRRFATYGNTNSATSFLWNYLSGKGQYPAEKRGTTKSSRHGQRCNPDKGAKEHIAIDSWKCSNTISKKQLTRLLCLENFSSTACTD